MAVSPEYLNKAFLREVDELETKLDEQLSKKTIAKGEVISMDVPSGMTRKHFDLLKTRYISAGWSDVKLNSDQREGSWLAFHY
jgi:hypothetical protein